MTCSGCRAKDCWRRTRWRSGWARWSGTRFARLPRVHASLAARLGAPEHQALHNALAAWTDERLRVMGATLEKREHIREEDGRAEARRHLVVRQASRRFGAVTGERLADLVEPMGPEELVHVGDAVVDSGTGEELLERASNGVSSKPLN